VSKCCRRCAPGRLGRPAPHNKLYRPEEDGGATTFAAFVAAGLGIRDPYQATADQVRQIQRGHLLLVMANALQPGVFSLSSWDLMGALPVPEKSVEKWIGEGDYRWVNRGGVDLIGANPDASTSAYGLPRSKTLYGPLPEQLKDPDSFVSQLKRVLAARQKYRLAEAELIAAPEVENPGVALLVLKLPEGDNVAITGLNFGRSGVEEELDLAHLPRLSVVGLRGRQVEDIVAGEAEGKVSESGRLKVQLPALTGKTLVIRAASP
jgi:trehalose synthase